MFALAVFGVSISAYLAFGYLNMAEIACTDTGCDFIRSWHDQRLPRAFIPAAGILYFLIQAALAYRLGTAKKEQGRSLALASMALGAAGTVVMAGLTSIEVSLRMYCFWCLLVAGATVLHFILSVLEWQTWRSGKTGYEMDFEPFIKWGAVPLLLVMLMVPTLEKSDAPDYASGGANTVSEGNAGTPAAGGNTFNPASPEAEQIKGRLGQVELAPENAHVQGPANAPVTLVEFADPGCMSCAQQTPILDELAKKYPNDVRVVYRHFPLKSHVHSPLAAEAMEAAGAQGKFYEMRDLLFRNIGRHTESDILQYAKQLNLDVERFSKDLKADTYVSRVQRDRAAGDALGIRRTPTLILKSGDQAQVFTGPKSLQELDALVQQHLKAG